MLKYCLDKWNKNNKLLKEKLERDCKLNRCDYSYLVELVVDYILNPSEDELNVRWDSTNITVVDNGEYQGTQLFLIPARTYQPSEYEYLMTYVGYGSCSGCDTLQAIQGWSDEPLTPIQVKDFMALCKDLVTSIIKPYNCGWRNEECFEEVTVEKEN